MRIGILEVNVKILDTLKILVLFAPILVVISACAPSDRQYTNQMEELHREWDYLLTELSLAQTSSNDEALDIWLYEVSNLRPPRSLAFEHNIYVSVHKDFIGIFRVLREDYAHEARDINIINCYLAPNQVSEAFKQACNLLLKAQQDVGYVRAHWTWDLLKLESVQQ